MAVAVGRKRFTGCQMGIVGVGQRLGRANLLLAICLVIENHVARCPPKMRADCGQGHVRWTQLADTKLVAVDERANENVPASGNTIRDTPLVALHSLQARRSWEGQFAPPRRPALS